MGFAVTDDLEIVFDTTADTRKHRNLRADTRIALVVGWDHEITAQIEGIADFPAVTSSAAISAGGHGTWPRTGIARGPDASHRVALFSMRTRRRVL